MMCRMDDNKAVHEMYQRQAIDTWYNDVFMPSLFEKFQKRDKQYCRIIISEKQADCCARYMAYNTNARDNYYGHTTYTYSMRGNWQGRDTTLWKEKNRYFLSFGNTYEEQLENAKQDATVRFEKEFERLAHYIDVGKVDMIERCKNRLESEYERLSDSVEMYIEDGIAPDALQALRLSQVKQLIELISQNEVHQAESYEEVFENAS